GKNPAGQIIVFPKQTSFPKPSGLWHNVLREKAIWQFLKKCVYNEEYFIGGLGAGINPMGQN
ncbi:MAG: hypothetical protein DRI89_14135, partial [Bacteroidetes bacterium]